MRRNKSHFENILNILNSFISSNEIRKNLSLLKCLSVRINYFKTISDIAVWQAQLSSVTIDSLLLIFAIKLGNG